MASAHSSGCCNGNGFLSRGRTRPRSSISTATFYGAATGIQPRCGEELTQKALLKPRWNCSLKTEAEACLYFHFNATQTLFCFSYCATHRKHLRQTPQEDSSASCLPCKARGGRKKLPTQTASQLLQASPQPPELQITAHAWASRFLHRHSGAVSWNFKGNPTNNGFGYR